MDRGNKARFWCRELGRGTTVALCSRVHRLSIAVVLAGCVEPALAGDAQAVLGGQPVIATDSVVALAVGSGLRCSGALISERVVITAAHCIPSDGAVSVYAGWSLAEPTIDLAVAATHVHPRYDGTHHDLASIELADPAPLPPLTVSSITNEMTVGTAVEVIGFGLSENAAGAKRSGGARITAIAADVIELAPDPALPCDGDSGGPTVVRGSDGIARVIAVHSLSNCVDRAIDQRIDSEFASFIAPVVAATDRQTCTDNCGDELVGGCSSSNPSLCCLALIAALLRRARCPRPSSKETP